MAASIAVIVPVTAAPAQAQAETKVVTTLTAFDAPPEAGGRALQSTPVSPPPLGVDPAAILNDLTGPVASLFGSETSSFEAATGQSTTAPRAAAAAEPDFTLLDCYASKESEKPEGWVVEHMRYCNVAFLRITKMVCNIFGGNCRETGSVRWRVGTIGRGTPSGERAISFVMVFDQWVVTGDGANSSLNVLMSCVKTVGSPCQNAGGLANNYTRTIPAWTSAPTTAFRFSSPAAGSFGVDQISQHDFNSVFRLVGANQVQLGANTFRCDSATYLPSIAGGCVFPDVIELFKLRRSDPDVNETAEHILFAQTTPSLTFPLAPFKIIPRHAGLGHAAGPQLLRPQPPEAQPGEGRGDVPIVLSALPDARPGLRRVPVRHDVPGSGRRRRQLLRAGGDKQRQPACREPPPD